MKEITLTQGKTAIVDDDDFDRLSKYKWSYGKRYAVTASSIRGQLIYMHHLVMPVEDGKYTDHINGNPLDNRKENLRECTHQQNCQNRGIRNDNTSGYKGVSWFKPRNKWRASIYVNKKQKLIGLFDTAVLAAKAYDEQAKRHFGPFANVNF